MRKRNLVIVRAGANSLHPEWLNQSVEDRNWDLLLSYYDQKAYDNDPDAAGTRKHLAIGGKCDGIAATCAEMPIYRDYDYVWLPDDDIRTTGQTINTLFDMMAAHELVIGQPSLSHDSYYYFPGLLQNTRFQLRYTNYVEIMVPCLRADFLRDLLPLFATSRSGFGIDRLWSRFMPDPWKKCAIIDSISVQHTRPIGQFLATKIAAQGMTSHDEENAIYALFGGIKPAQALVYAAIDQHGIERQGQVALGWQMYRDIWRNPPALEYNENRNKSLRKMLKRQLFYPTQLTNLPIPPVPDNEDFDSGPVPD